MKDTIIQSRPPVVFSALPAELPSIFSIGNYGPPGSGKTRLGTTLPGKVAVIPFDMKCRRTVSNLERSGVIPRGKCVFPKDDFVRHVKPMALIAMDNAAQMRHYRQHIERAKEAIYSVVDRADIDSIMIDPGTQLSEDVLFANYGRDQKIMPRDRGEFNSEMKLILSSMAGKNLLITHEAKETWRGEKPTGKFTWKGWGSLGYNVNLILEHTCSDGVFRVAVRQCQDKPELIGDDMGLANEDITFEMIALNVFGENWGGG